MIKKLLLFIVSFFCFFCSTSCIGFYGTPSIPNGINGNQANTPQEGEQESHEGDFGKEELVKNMFYTHGDYSDGTYSFRKGNTQNNSSFVYSFSYNPELDLYYCGHLATSRTELGALHDDGSIVFSWGDIENGSFYGYHEANFYGYNEMDNVARIEFTFDNLQFNDDLSLGDNCSYQVTKNTFKALEKTEDIDEYAITCFECIEIAIGYAQTILYTYTSNIELW